MITRKLQDAITRRAWTTPMVMAMSVVTSAAQAQTTGAGQMAQPLVTILQSIQSVVIGPLGVSIFIIGLAFLGIACLRGMVPWGWVVAWVIGAVFLFGAPTLVSEIQSGVGGG